MLFREVPPKVLFLSVYHRHFLECIAPHFSVICFQNQVSCGFYSQDTSLEDALFIPVRMKAVTAIQGCHISTPNLFLLFLKQTEVAVVKTFQETFPPGHIPDPLSVPVKQGSKHHSETPAGLY